ncbi:MAG: pilus assembly protein PilP [Gammaproteobacteria bacterium]|nr:pilus assembly protein PilP [Gammaproteobacteria bacterium]
MKIKTGRTLWHLFIMGVVLLMGSGYLAYKGDPLAASQLFIEEVESRGARKVEPMPALREPVETPAYRHGVDVDPFRTTAR